jgi:hypothetical protein
MPPFLFGGLATGVSVEPVHGPAHQFGAILRATSWRRSIRGKVLTDRVQLARRPATIGFADGHGFLARLVDRPASASGATTLGSNGKRLGVASISQVAGEILLTARKRAPRGRQIGGSRKRDDGHSRQSQPCEEWLDGWEPSRGRGAGDKIMSVGFEWRQHAQLRRGTAYRIGSEHAPRQLGSVGLVVLGVKPKSGKARGTTERSHRVYELVGTAESIGPKGACRPPSKFRMPTTPGGFAAAAASTASPPVE